MFKSQTQILKLISIILLFTLTLTANTPPLNTTYTQGGLLKTATDATGTITYTYDNMGRTTKVDNPDGSFVTYAHDNVGNIIEVKTPTQTISKTYDALNRLSTVTDAQGITSYTYDAIGRQTQIVYPNGTTTNYVYDSRNRVTSITHKSSGGATLQSFTYTLDAVGNRTQVVESSGRTVNYTYNNVNQLTQEVVTNDPSGNNTTTTYSYDLVGNLVTKIVDGTSTTYTYNNNDQLTQQDAQTFTYDGNGNLIQKDSTSYEYDDKNRLTKATTPTSTIEYKYDANDNRIAKVVDGATTSYLIDTNTAYAQVITESSGGTDVHYTYGNDLISNGSQFFLTDALGSTRGLVDSSETLTDSYDYTPYGEIASHVGTSENNFLFTGEQLDKESDNYYLRARYYSPEQARFTSIDPFEGRTFEPITLNDYAYAGSNPTMYVDPSGRVFTGGGISGVAFAINGIGTLARSAAGTFFTRRAAVNMLVGSASANGYRSVLFKVLSDQAVGAVLEMLMQGYATKATYGSAAHKAFEKKINKYFGNRKMFGIYIKPEVFIDYDGKASSTRKLKGFLGIDILVYNDKKNLFLIDLKTGGRFSAKRRNELKRRFNVDTVIELQLFVSGRK